MQNNEIESSIHTIPNEQEKRPQIQSLYEQSENMENIYQSQIQIPQLNRMTSMAQKLNFQLPNDGPLAQVALPEFSEKPINSDRSEFRTDQQPMDVSDENLQRYEDYEENKYESQYEGSQNQMEIYEHQKPSIANLIRQSTLSRSNEGNILQKKASSQSYENTPGSQRTLNFSPLQKGDSLNTDLQFVKEEDDDNESISEFEEQNLLLIFIKTVLFYMPVLYFVLVLIYSILLIQKNLSLELKDLPSAQKIVINIWDNLHRPPIEQILMVQEGQDCQLGFQQQILYNWKGTREGCFCDGEYIDNLDFCKEKTKFLINDKEEEKNKIQYNKVIRHHKKQHNNNNIIDFISHKNDKKQSCINIPQTDPSFLYNWSQRKIQFCIKLLDLFYFTNSTDKCSQGYNKCFDNLCTNNSKVCPITTIPSLSQHSHQQKNFQKKQKNHFDKNFKTHKTQNVTKYNPITNLRVVIDSNKICLDPYLLPKSKVPEFFLLRQQRLGCGVFAQFDQESTIDTLGQSQLNEFLQHNEMTEILDTFPYFKRKASTEHIYLIAEKQVGIDFENIECLQLLNKNPDKYFFLILMKEIDINSFINPTLQKMLYGFAVASILLSSIYSFLTIFYLWQNEKELEIFCFLKLSLPQIYVLSFLLVIVVGFQKIYYLVFMQQNMLLMFQQESMILNEDCFSDPNVVNVLIKYQQILSNIGTETRYLIDVQYFITFCFVLLTISSALIKVYIYSHQNLSKPIFNLNHQFLIEN